MAKDGPGIKGYRTRTRNDDEKLRKKEVIRMLAK